MAIQTFSNLRTRSQEIKNETVDEANTTLRVGSLHEDTVDTTESSINNITANAEELNAIPLETIATLPAINTEDTTKRIVEITGGADAGIYFHNGTLLKKMTTTDVAIPISGVLNDGNTVAQYIADDLSTITKDGSDRVSEWRDYLGSGRNLVVENAGDTSFHPIWSATGLTFNGVFNTLQGAFTMNIPCYVYMVCNVDSTGDNFGALFAGYSASTAEAFITDPTTTPQFRIKGPSGDHINSTMIVNSFVIIRALLNGASSKSIINGLTPATGETRSTNMGGFILGSSGLGYNGAHCKMVTKEVILRSGDDTANETAIYNYLADKYTL